MCSFLHFEGLIPLYIAGSVDHGSGFSHVKGDYTVDNITKIEVTGCNSSELIFLNSTDTL